MYRSRSGAQLAMGFLLVLASVCPAPRPAAAETLSDTIDSIFRNALDIQLSGPQNTQHGNHFRLSNVAASDAARQAFQTLIAANATSFPLSSTVSGVTFDFSSGVPVATTTSLGPIFAERAQTLGRRRMNVGLNASFLDFEEFRGVPTRQLQFSFAHEDVPAPGQTTPGGLGNNENEFDVLNMIIDMNVEAQVVAFYATVGITDRLDVGVAVPVTRVSVSGRSRATFDSFTMARNDSANHFFGQPGNLTYRQSFDNSASGIGDLAVRAKLNLHRGQAMDVALFADLRLPTGDEEAFLGTGDSNLRGHLVLSWTAAGFNPHLNAGFEYRGADYDPNELEIIAGFDQKLAERLTFAAEFSGEYEVGGGGVSFPAPTTISGDLGGALQQPLTKVVSATNLPNRADNLNNGSFGIKWSPRERFLLLANAIVAVNHGGLRADVVPTFGVEYSF